MALPDFDSQGDLPPGVHAATFPAIIARFGIGGARRQQVTANLLRVHQLVQGTGLLERFVIFGSYVTSEPDPNDVDVFLSWRRNST